MAKTPQPHKCGWCLAGEHDKCRPEYVFEGRVYDCTCTHPPVTQAQWLGYEKYTMDIEGMPE